ncbi:MAG: TIGR02281 family clan AA aspartic protease [Methylococcales bacterium]|nr:TIGR02281 family clan AA aspartic protease [Methylococcales bacterium]
MGLQDRDYYREKHKEAHQSPRPLIRKSGKTSTGIKYLLYPLITIVALWYGADTLLDKINGITLIRAPIVDRKEIPLDLISGGVILKTDRQGHFRGTALVNNVPVPFLIDTGATQTVIPRKMAVDASLPFGRFIEASTAGGKVAERETRINSLVIGNAVIKNLDAHINDHLDEALIGMNTLKYFHMTQSGDTLTLVANNQLGNSAPSAQAFHQSNDRIPIDTLAPDKPIKKPIALKKTVACNERKVCKTTYSDH